MTELEKTVVWFKEKLNLNCTVEELKNLEWLDLRGTQVVDLTPLAFLKNLEWLYLFRGSCNVVNINLITREVVIACEAHGLEEWFQNGREIWLKHRYSESQITEYQGFLQKIKESGILEGGNQK